MAALDFDSYVDEILDHFSTQWSVGGNTEEIADDNDPDYDPPNDANGNPLPWLRHTIEPAFSEQATMGPTTNGVYKEDGNSLIEVFVPLGDKIDNAKTLAQKVAVIMRGVKLTTVWLQAPFVVRVGQVDDTWWKYVVETPYMILGTAA